METISANGTTLSASKSLLNSAFLSQETEILRIVGEYVMQLPLEEEQYKIFY